MYKLLAWETESSSPISRTFFDLCTAYKLAKGGYHKAQIIDEFNVILYEF
ncbi:hypothetical protein [Escherichia phage UPEC06]|nr:hypothetical protein [Escherichia phage UPEC06]